MSDLLYISAGIVVITWTLAWLMSERPSGTTSARVSFDGSPTETLGSAGSRKLLEADSRKVLKQRSCSLCDEDKPEQLDLYVIKEIAKWVCFSCSDVISGSVYSIKSGNGKEG